MPNVIYAVGQFVMAALEAVPVIGHAAMLLDMALPGSILYSFVGTTVVLAAEMGIATLLMPSPQKVDGQFSITQPVPFRRRIYGRAKVAGAHIFWDSRSGKLYTLIALASHQLDAIEEHWLADRRVTLENEDAGGGSVTLVNYPPGANQHQYGKPEDKGYYVSVFYQLGDDSKVSYQQLQDQYPGLWTAQHIGYGVADVLTIQKATDENSFAGTYPGGPQPYRGVVRGARIVDPRNIGSSPTPAEAWTDNAVCVLRDYLTHQDGWRISSTYFDTGAALPITQASADTCDELVPLSSGGSEPRYRIWGFYDFNEEPRTVLARFLCACGGWLQPQTDGTIAIRVGEWIEPDFTLSDEHILAYDIQHFLGVFDVINEVRATFNYGVDGADYQETESYPWQDAADIQKRGYIKSTTLDTRHCPTYTQCRRIQKIGMAEVSPEWTVNVTTDAYGLGARNKRFINFQLDELGLTITCRVTSFRFNLRTGQCFIGLASFGSDAYEWSSTAEEEGPAPPVPPDTSTTNTLETPVDFSAVPETTALSGTASGVYLAFSVQAPTDRNDLSVLFEWQLAGDPTSTWTPIKVTGEVYSARTQLLPAGVYNARCSYLTAGGLQSFYAEVDNIQVQPSTAAPPAPTDLAAPVFTGGNVELSFTAPNAANFACGGFWRSSDSTFADATLIKTVYGGANQKITFTDNPGVGTWRYWATSGNSSNPPNWSTPDGPVAATVA